MKSNEKTEIIYVCTNSKCKYITEIPKHTCPICKSKVEKL